MWEKAIQEFMKKENEMREEGEHEDIVQLLDRIVQKTTKIVPLKTEQKTVDIFSLKDEFKEVVRITPFSTTAFDAFVEEGETPTGEGVSTENELMSWVAYNFMSCVVDNKSVGKLLENSRVDLFAYATMSDFAFVLQVMEQYGVRWFNLALRALKSELPPSNEKELKEHKEKLRLMQVYGVGGNGMSSGEGQNRYEVITDYLCDNIEEDSNRMMSISNRYTSLMHESKCAASAQKRNSKEEYASETEEEKNKAERKRKRRKRNEERGIRGLNQMKRH